MSVLPGTVGVGWRGGEGGIAVGLAAECCVQQNISPTASFASLSVSFIADAHEDTALTVVLQCQK